MERGRKRKATTGASPAAENGGSKRQKTVLSDKDAKPNEATSQLGLQLVDQLKSAKDKNGRSIADLFLELPDKKELPDYYDAVKHPVCIDVIEDKLRRREYPTLAALDHDVKRMVANAKLYNDDRSVVFQDAERIRKLHSNFMNKHPPADATPEEQSEQPRKITLSLKGPRDRRSSVAADRKSSLAADAPASADAADFAGKTFQQAQEHLVGELIRHTDEDGLEMFHPFVNLPSRSLADYYKVIKKPVSLKALSKRVRGQHGREAPSMVSDFKSWDALEDEASYVWRNAREYNEDGSEMFNLAGEFEKHFKQRLALARSQVEEPSQPKIKLSAPRPKPVLHLGARSSPAPRAVPVNDDQKPAQPAANGQQTPTVRKASLAAAPSRSSSQVPASATTDKAQDVAASTPPAPTAAVKTEKSIAPSPSLSTARPQSAVPEVKQSPRPPTASMAPPAFRGPSGSPHPAAIAAPPAAPAYVPPPLTFVDQYARTKPLTEALLPSVAITTHPQLTLPKPFRIDVPASPAFTLQSLTVALPAAHYYISIIPAVSPKLLAGRQYKLFVTVNGARLMATTRDYVNGDVNGAGRKQCYDAVLNQGVNRIEVEIGAVAGRNGQLEVEKLCVFANLLKGRV